MTIRNIQKKPAKLSFHRSFQMKNNYAIEFIYQERQMDLPMSLNSFAIDRAAVADRLQSCQLGRYNYSLCAEKY